MPDPYRKDLNLPFYCPVPKPKTPPALIGALGLLGAEWQAGLRHWAKLVKPACRRLARSFEKSLRERGFDPWQRKALQAVTPGAAATLIAEGRAVATFLEQVDYHGRRLAKLNLPPSAVLEVLAWHSRFLEAELSRLGPGVATDSLPVRRQLDALIAITLNNAFYQVREAETEAFFELDRAELKSKNEAELLARCAEILRRYCQAEAGRVLVADGWLGLPRPLSQPRHLVLDGCPAERLLEPDWARRYRCAWSIPLPGPRRPAGVMQFAFTQDYRWLPRELQLLGAAGEFCRLACQKARLAAALAEREHQVRALAGHMLQVEEAERRRIRRELHDEAGQLLLCLRLQLERLEGLAPGELKSGLAGARGLVEQTIVEIRRLLADLSPAVLEQLGLPAALRQLVSRFRRLHSIPVALHLNRMGRLPPRVEAVLYRVLQECLNNVARHSSARSVMVSLRRDDRRLQLRVRDDGVGFDAKAALQRQDSFGLAGMRERVVLLGGACQIASRPGRGATVSIELPIHNSGQPHPALPGASGPAVGTPAPSFDLRG